MFQEVEAPRFQDNRHMKVARLSALCTGRLYPQEIFPVLISVRGSVDPHGHRAAERIMSMNNSNDTIVNRTRDLPTSSAVPQQTALRRDHLHEDKSIKKTLTSARAEGLKNSLLLNSYIFILYLPPRSPDFTTNF